MKKTSEEFHYKDSVEMTSNPPLSITVNPQPISIETSPSIHSIPSMNENLVTHSEEMEFIDGNVTNSSPTLTINLPNHIISTN